MTPGPPINSNTDVSLGQEETRNICKCLNVAVNLRALAGTDKTKDDNCIATL